MFKKNFIRLCNEKGISPSAACKEVGLNPATFSCWKDDSVPRIATLTRIAEFFEVSVDSLVGKDESGAPKPREGVSELDKQLIRIISTLSEDDKAWLLELITNILNRKN